VNDIEVGAPHRDLLQKAEEGVGEREEAVTDAAVAEYQPPNRSSRIPPPSAASRNHETPPPS
jgi:hypothetical protein